MNGRAIRRAGLAAGLWFCAAATTVAGETVLTALPPLQAIAAALADGTSLTVEAVPQPFAGMARLPRALARADAALDAKLRGTAAVVSVASVWADDPLYREARSRNIRVVSIDAARAIDRPSTSVAVVARPDGHALWRAGERADAAGARGSAVAPGSPYVWFSLANGARMAEIVAADLKRLAPSDAQRVEANLARFTATLMSLRAASEQTFAGLPDTRLFALTDRFVYLTNEFGFDVDGYFLEEDPRWTAADYQGLADHLRERSIRVVIHHWRPAEPIVKAIEAGGARLVVLDDMETSAAPIDRPAAISAWPAAVKSNLDALAAAFAAAARDP